MPKDYNYECVCGHIWHRNDYIDYTDKDAEDYDEDAEDFADGYNCPKCGSENVGEEGWNNN